MTRHWNWNGVPSVVLGNVRVTSVGIPTALTVEQEWRCEMARLINTVALMKRINRYPPYIRDVVEKELRYVPTVDPVKHGHWVKSNSDYEWECSSCGYGYTDYKITYCYDCGAKMDEVKHGKI